MVCTFGFFALAARKVSPACSFWRASAVAFSSCLACILRPNASPVSIACCSVISSFSPFRLARTAFI